MNNKRVTTHANDQIQVLTDTFEGHAQETENGFGDHIVDINKMVELGSGSQREILGVGHL